MILRYAIFHNLIDGILQLRKYSLHNEVVNLVEQIIIISFILLFHLTIPHPDKNLKKQSAKMNKTGCFVCVYVCLSLLYLSPHFVLETHSQIFLPLVEHLRLFCERKTNRKVRKDWEKRPKPHSLSRFLSQLNFHTMKMALHFHLNV